MNCEEVANHFSDYLDQSLDTATMTRVATHIIACPLCRAESNEIADCIDQVASLPVLDPPIGFAQRVMAHVREVEEKPTVWQWLFQSLEPKGSAASHGRGDRRRFGGIPVSKGRTAKTIQLDEFGLAVSATRGYSGKRASTN